MCHYIEKTNYGSILWETELKIIKHTQYLSELTQMILYMELTHLS